MQKSFNIFAAVTVTALALSLAVEPAKAAVINWGTPVTIAGTGSQVDTTGSLVASANFGSGTAATVNGVTFNAFSIVGSPTSATVGAITVAALGASVNSSNLANLNTGDSTSGTPYNLLGDTAYRALVAQTAVVRSGGSMDITVGGLTPQAQYLVQYWASDSRLGASTRVVTLNATNSVTLDVNSTDSAGGIGQWVTGTFTADASSQSFSVVGSTGIPTTYANAMQVRMIAVPEPTQMVFVAAIGAALGMWRTRKLRRDGRGSDATAC